MSIINQNYLKESTRFSNGKVKNVFGELSNLPAIYLLNAGVIVGQAPSKVLKYYLQDADWNHNQEEGRRVLNSLTMLSSLDVDDSIINIVRNGRVVSYPVHEYQVPSNLGLDIIACSSDRIYTTEAARKKNLQGFYRDITNIDYELVGATENKYYTLAEYASKSAEELEYTRLFDEDKQAWNNVMSPTELKSWFEEWNNHHRIDFTWTSVEKKEYTISHYGCFYSGAEGKEQLCLAGDTAGDAKDVLVTALGITSKVDLTSMYSKMNAIDPEEIYHYIAKGDVNNDANKGNGVVEPGADA